MCARACEVFGGWGRTSDFIGIGNFKEEQNHNSWYLYKVLRFAMHDPSIFTSLFDYIYLCINYHLFLYRCSFGRIGLLLSPFHMEGNWGTEVKCLAQGHPAKDGLKAEIWTWIFLMPSPTCSLFPLTRDRHLLNNIELWRVTYAIGKMFPRHLNSGLPYPKANTLSTRAYYLASSLVAYCFPW